jgi:hypothetical protein
LESTLPEVLILKPLKVPLDSTLFEKRGGGYPVIVNQISDKEICPEEHRDEGSLLGMRSPFGGSHTMCG